MFEFRKKLKTFILVKESANGIETFIDDKAINNFPTTYKAMLAAFLGDAYYMVAGKKGKKNDNGTERPGKQLDKF